MRRTIRSRFVALLLCVSVTLSMFPMSVFGTEDMEQRMPTEVVEFNGHKYKLFTEKKNWDDAKRFCEEQGGHLVTITSQAEQDFIEEQGVAWYDHVWIGATDISGQYEWVTGEPFEYTNWMEGQPDDAHGETEHYAIMRTPEWDDRRLNGDGEEKGYSFLCEWEDGVENVPDENNKIEFKGHQYQIFDEVLTWYEAKNKCESLGGHLVTITSKDENDFIKKEVLKGDSLYYWLGATDEEKEGAWKWVTGEEWTYSNWRMGQPDNQNRIEHYLMMYQDKDSVNGNGLNGLWNDESIDCSEYVELNRQGYICEWDVAVDKQAGFRLSLDQPTDCLKVGTIYEAQLGYYENGNLDISCKEPIIEIDNPSVVELEKIQWSDESGQVYRIKALSQGFANLTITNPENGDSSYFKLHVVKGDAGYTFDAVPKMKIEEGRTTNFYNFGKLCVDEFTYTPKKNLNGEIKEYAVSFNVYNTLNLYAAVTSYDSKGNIHQFRLADKKEALEDNFIGTLGQLWYEIGDLGHLIDNHQYYSGKSISKETKITIDVPVGGHIEISNNMGTSTMAQLANIFGFIIDFSSTLTQFVGNSKDILDNKTTIIKNVIDSINKTVLIDNEDIEGILGETIQEELGKIDFSYESFNDALYNIQKRLGEFGINFMKNLQDEFFSLGSIADTGEDVLLDIIVTGKLINWMFSLSSAADQLSVLFFMKNSVKYPSGIFLYAPGQGDGYASNGVFVKPETIDEEVMIHSYIVYDEHETGMTEETFANEEYEVRSIKMYKRGEEVQPESKVQVKITLSEKFRKSDRENLKVYRINGDGSKTDMNAKFDDEYAIFETEHFSYYAIVLDKGEDSQEPSENDLTPPISIPQYTIEASAEAGGTISPSGISKIDRGLSKTYTIMPNEGYQIANVIVDGKSVGAVSEYTFENVAVNHTIVAKFEKKEILPSVDEQIAAIKSAKIKASTSIGKNKRGQRYIKVQWTEPETDADGYEIYRSFRKNSGYKKFYTTKKCRYFNTKQLKEGKRHYYKVRAYKVINGKRYYSRWSNLAYRTLPELTVKERIADAKAVKLKATTVTGTNKKGQRYIKVKWTKSGASVNGYDVYRSFKKTDGYKKIFTAKKQYYYNTKELKKGRRHYYKVRAYTLINSKKYYSKWSNLAYRTLGK